MYVDSPTVFKLIAMGVGTWLGTSIFFGYLSGWRQLATVYGWSRQRGGFKRSFQSAHLRGIGFYNNCLTFRADSQGMCISIPLLLRAGHTTLFIPWKEISLIERRKQSSLVELRFQAVPSIRLRIKRELYQDLAQFVKRDLT